MSCSRRSSPTWRKRGTVAASWGKFLKGSDAKVAGDFVDVPLGNGRAHRVNVEELDDGYRLSGVVVRSGGEEFALKAWLRNRAVSVVAFQVSEKGRLVGSTFVSAAGLSAHEFRFSVFAVATECDRFEAILTGRDVE